MTTQLSQSLIDKAQKALKRPEASLTSGELVELREFCQEVFRFRVDIHCGACVIKYLRKTATYLNEHDTH